MNTVKTRKIGEALVLPIPEELGIAEGKEFIIYKGIDDVLVLAPKIPNPFDDMEPFVMENDFDGAMP